MVSARSRVNPITRQPLKAKKYCDYSGSGAGVSPVRGASGSRSQRRGRDACPTTGIVTKYSDHSGATRLPRPYLDPNDPAAVPQHQGRVRFVLGPAATWMTRLANFASSTTCQSNIPTRIKSAPLLNA